jgi:hypothetical protein
MRFTEFICRLFGITITFTRKQIMSLDEKIAADQAAVVAAQAVLDAANATVVADQASKAAWDAVEANAAGLTHDSIKAQVLALVAAGRTAEA